jgi:hypothetical protein
MVSDKGLDSAPNKCQRGNERVSDNSGSDASGKRYQVHLFGFRFWFSSWSLPVGTDTQVSKGWKSPIVFFIVLELLGVFGVERTHAIAAIVGLFIDQRLSTLDAHVVRENGAANDAFLRVIAVFGSATVGAGRGRHEVVNYVLFKQGKETRWPGALRAAGPAGFSSHSI